MLIKIPNIQVPKYWELIKLGCVKSDDVQKNAMHNYCVKLLCDLLSEKMFAVLIFDDSRTIQAVSVMEITDNQITNKRYLKVRNLYGINPVTTTQWNEDIEQLKLFAQKEDCAGIITSSNNPRVWDILKLGGFKSKCREYVYTF